VGLCGAASLWTKTKIMAAGVVMNLVTALILLTALAWIGIPKLLDNQFTVKSDTKIVRNDVILGDVEPNSPASKAGLRADDRLVSIQRAGASKQIAINSSEDLPNATKQFAGDKVTVTYERAGDVRQVATTLRTTGEVDALYSSRAGYWAINICCSSSLSFR
jgi:S1-C subfamily serine protease